MGAETDMAERFPKDVAEHHMTVLRDDGLYRHVRFLRVAANPETGKPEKSSFYWFDLITWPGCLAVNGDCGSYLFSRTDDMFEFFRGGRINPGYWAEKVRAGGRVKEYSEDRFRELVADYINSGDEEFPSLAQEWPGLAGAVEKQIFTDGEIWHEHGARAALTEFSHGVTFKGKCPSCDAAVEGLPEADAYSWASQHRVQAGHAVYPSRDDGFEFTDVWEWDLSDWDWQFLWCCHAIQWGIGQYDRNTAPAVETVPVAGGAV